MLCSSKCQRCFMTVGSDGQKPESRDLMQETTTLTTAAAGLHVTSRCAICGQSFEWVSCHKGMRLVLQADTGFERLPLLVFIMSREDKGSIEGFTLQILVVFDTWRRCWTQARAQKRITGLYSYSGDFLALIFWVGKKKDLKLQCALINVSVDLLSCCLSYLSFPWLHYWFCSLNDSMALIYFKCFSVSTVAFRETQI